jgi:hypothetical protein
VRVSQICKLAANSKVSQIITGRPEIRHPYPTPLKF